MAFRSAVSARTPTPAPARVRRRLSLVRRSNFPVLRKGEAGAVCASLSEFGVKPGYGSIAGVAAGVTAVKRSMKGIKWPRKPHVFAVANVKISRRASRTSTRPSTTR
ncbi:hypothetical protein AGR5A_Cc20031 [Agrobacterium genomosp. 5 str. CFBP 6626]|nr:hypothetical protein AGR5A_Cc20031 [Agrobacterium genomosp. 5 str. CFBP 6626]